MFAGTVDASRVRLWLDDFHVLRLAVDGREFEDVRAVRAFPVSGKSEYVSFLDDKAKEIVLLANPRQLDKDSRRALRKALERMYYTPRITRIDSIKETWGVTHWEAQTDRGYATFEGVDREHIRRLPRGRFIIHDADGNRFEIEGVDKLDPRSRLLLQSET